MDEIVKGAKAFVASKVTGAPSNPAGALSSALDQVGLRPREIRPTTTAQTSAYKILANCRYRVAIDGIEYAAFSEVSGLQIETETMDFIEGGFNDRVLRLPVRSKVGNITLKRGITSGNELLHWHLRIVQGYLDLKNVTIYVYDTRGDVLTRFELLQAFPVKWAGPQFMGAGDAVAVETLEIAHSGSLQVST